MGDDDAINPTDSKEPTAAEHTRSRSDIFCVGVSVGVHVHASLFVCLHFASASIQERLVKFTLRLIDDNLHSHSLAYCPSLSVSPAISQLFVR